MLELTLRQVLMRASSRRSYLRNKRKVLLRKKKRREAMSVNERKAAWLHDKYKMSLEQWKSFYKKQHGLCAICRCKMNKTKEGPHVDHDHKLGKPRGLLCGACNRMLGLAHDSVNTLRKAITYLQRSRVGA